MTMPRQLARCEARPGASVAAIAAAQWELGQRLPRDYVEFLRASNGIEGCVGNHGYVQLWPAEDLAERNRGYDVAEQLPGFLLLGSDGGGTAYGLWTDGARRHYPDVPFIVMCEEDLRVLGGTFLEFLDALADDE
jgi:SMI1/KNR4 family protein SUKH-1